MRVSLKKEGITNLLVFPDLQFPDIDKQTLKAVEKFILDKDSPRFHMWLQGGDFMDFPYCSKWTKGNLRFLEKKRFLDDYADCNKWLDHTVGVLKKNNPKIDMHVIEGNHDIRPEKYIDVHPALEGILEMENNLHFEKHGIKYHKTWENKRLLQIGKANFHHYPSVNGSVGQNHTKQMINKFHDNIFYFHTNDVNCTSKQTYGSDKTFVAQSLGTLCRYDMPFVGQAPTNWQQAITVFQFLPDGHFTYYVLRIFKHRFIWNGKVFKP